MHGISVTHAVDDSYLFKVLIRLTVTERYLIRYINVVTGDSHIFCRRHRTAADQLPVTTSGEHDWRGWRGKRLHRQTV